MADLSQLATPCLIVDRDKVAANAARLKAHLGKLGVPLRLHVKTAKSLEAVALVLDGRKDPITVSTLKEAEQFFEGGYRDILYAVGFAPGKLARALLFPLRYLDRAIPDSYAMDSASAYYFLGRRTQRELTPEEIVVYYRGAQRARDEPPPSRLH